MAEHRNLATIICRHLGNNPATTFNILYLIYNICIIGTPQHLDQLLFIDNVLGNILNLSDSFDNVTTLKLVAILENIVRICQISDSNCNRLYTYLNKTGGIMRIEGLREKEIEEEDFGYRIDHLLYNCLEDNGCLVID